MTPEEIEADIREKNPTTRLRGASEYVGPGDPDYESQIAVWVADAIETDAKLAIVRTRKIWPTAAAFLGEFDLAKGELSAISLSTDPTVAALRLLLAAWPADVWSDDPRIQMGMARLVEVGILTQERSDEILTLN